MSQALDLKLGCCGAASLAFRAEGGTWYTCSGVCADEHMCGCVWVDDVALPGQGVMLAFPHSDTLGAAKCL